MPEPTRKRASELSLDLQNFRMAQQADELAAIHSMIAIDPKHFWGLVQSIINEGYTGEENLIVLEDAADSSILTVKEGNRRLAAMKYLRGMLPLDGDVPIPATVQRGKAQLTKAATDNQRDIPVLVYPASEAAAVDRIVSRKHGRDRGDGRSGWDSVPKARHNRAQGANEPGLDLLEKYLAHGKNLTDEEKSRWQGAYNLTILDEALARVVAFLGRTTSVRDLVNDYPKSTHRTALESLLAAIGRGDLTFPRMRNTRPDEPWSPADHGFKAPASPPQPSGEGTREETSGEPKSGTKETAKGASARESANEPSGADRLENYKDLQKWFKSMSSRINGDHREKVAMLAKEGASLNVDKAPHAVAFLVRSMFELSAKAYCKDHRGEQGVPTYADREGKLETALLAIIAHIRNVEGDQAMLYGAELELRHDEQGPHFLSMKSMHQLIHNPQYVIDGRRFLGSFKNLKHLLEAMNR